MSKKFPFYKQHDAMDCGATCLRMIARFHGRFYSLEFLRELTFIGKDGVALIDIADAAEKIGMNTLAAKVSWKRLVEGLPLPMIVHWRQQHFMVVYEVTPQYVRVADPASGKYKLTRDEFLDGWASDIINGEPHGILLLLETTPEFFEREGEKTDKSGFRFLFTYLFRFKKLLIQLLLGMLLGSFLQLIMPFLMQAVVDVGISTSNLGFIKLVLLGQVIVFFSQASVEFIRGWILLHIGTRVNISLVSDFLIKLMKLPVRFFDSKLTGDLLQRINDNHRVEQFLTSSTLVTLFSMINFVVFGVVLAFFNMSIFGIYFMFTAFYVAWITLFLRKRKELDYKRFDQMSENQSSLIQLIYGMQEIKLHNAEKQKRWQWERIQAKLYRVSISYLALEQYQRAGAFFFNEFKNILITFLAAKAVVEGQLSIGSMVAIEYIIGQLNAPLEQLIHFIQAAQDAKISLERLNEIHSKEDEDGSQPRLNALPPNGDLILENVRFRYGSQHSPMVLKGIDLHIPRGKTVAIVGGSGSGKTTILKLLLNFYQPTEGAVRLGDVSLNNIAHRVWRDRCGVVLQDGFIFSETIAKNIALGEDIIDKRRLLQAVKIANIQSYIDSLPLGYNTKIGDDGVGLSQGQKQRLLIARAVYKNPDYVFFDEATNALDSYNELIIMDNLNEFLAGRTVVVVAHRLSTVRNADKIIVLEKGEIIEEGTHSELTLLRGAYYNLVKNQLELGV
ncbi:MAG: peptidase domain-containing ABC transporter [Saprospiraceae bacterium]|nr:peptidase domain-containing ABC transporter [Saprospiraceae bacterium]